jgi:predicted Zn-dependent peptidase
MIPTLRLPRGAALAAELAEGARSFAAGFWFPIGSRHEAPRERGFVHFVEHMVFKGTSHRSAAEISRQIERVGGYLNAFTDRDSICVHCQVPAARWELALELLADMLLDSAFRSEDFLREREVIVSEILSARDDPEECSHDEFLASIWPGDPLSRKIAGEPEDLRRATRDALYDFYRAEFAPSRLLVTAAGPVPPAAVAEKLSRLLDAVPGGDDSRARASAPRLESAPAFSRASAYRSADMEQVHYYEAVQLDPPFSEKDYYALSAVNGAIGEASSSRLFLSLREEKGLCYSVYSAFGMTRTECLWMAAANASGAVLPELVEEMDAQLDRAAAEGLGEKECVDAVSRLAGSFDVALDDPDFRMRRIARQLLFSGEADSSDEARERMAALAADDLNAACARLLKGRERARFAYGKLSRRAAKASGLAGAKARGLAGAKARGLAGAKAGDPASAKLSEASAAARRD